MADDLPEVSEADPEQDPLEAENEQLAIGVVTVQRGLTVAVGNESEEEWVRMDADGIPVSTMR